MSLSALPIELTLRTLAFFHPRELVNFRRVNSFFKSLIDETTTIQYRIALFASGSEDGPPGDLTISKRLELLRIYEVSWKNLEWNEYNTIPSKVPSPIRGIWEFYGNVWAYCRGAANIEFIQLPSHLRGIPMRHWILRFDFEVREFGVDSSQDLLVTIENFENNFLIHLFILSTGEKHPLAGSNAVVEYSTAHNQLSHSVQISGDHIGIIFDGELVVWSWKTGVRKLALLVDLLSFVFLGDKFILGSTLNPPALLVYSLQQGLDGTTQANTYLLRFLFPFPNLINIMLASDSSPGWLPSAGPQVPFQISGDMRIVTMNLLFHRVVEPYETFLIPMKTLLGYIESLPINGRHDMDWGSHGPLLSERVPGPGRWDMWTRFIFGMRYILPKVAFLHGKPMMIVCDICPRRCLRASEEERQESKLLYQKLMGVHHTDQSYPRSILKSVPFPENIPYPENVTLMISEDGIVVLEQPTAVDSSLHLFTF